jgi:predicted secreted hydrolase
MRSARSAIAAPQPIVGGTTTTASAYPYVMQITNASHYYSLTRMPTRGTLRIDGHIAECAMTARNEGLMPFIRQPIE